MAHSTAEVAGEMARLCKAGDLKGAMVFYADSIVSIEGDGTKSEGIAAIHGKSEWWDSTHETHSFTADGPYIHGDQFVLNFTMDITDKATEKRGNFRESALYTVSEGKVVEERFFLPRREQLLDGAKKLDRGGGAICANPHLLNSILSRRISPL